MRKLFRSFERFDLEYLLISGQASILYGAATFSEDVDLWIRPTAPNARRLLRALSACGARIHKHTPPLTQRHMMAGHGFHFVIPLRPPVYLDIMGHPPRVGSFELAFRRQLTMDTPWGRLPVVGIDDLILLKMTRRLSDYEVISNLVRIRLRETPVPSPLFLKWAARNTFRAEDRVRLCRALGRGTSVGECRRQIAAEIARHQARDSAYWSRVIQDLRSLRRRGLLLPDGVPVRELR
ncbi:MAG: hypothetical protein HYY16_02260 [Planctomycetes bacterium]|nr:hypothetical protein [Planctomycetota bacterium]